MAAGWLCVLLVVMINVLYSDAWLYNLFKGEVWPVDPYLVENETLTLYCAFGQYESNLNSSYLYFKWKPTHSSNWATLSADTVSPVNETTIRLVKHNVQKDHSGVYSCWLNKSTEDNKEVNRVEVMILAPPKPITHLECIVDSNYNMTCSWCDQAESDVNYSLLWRISGVRNGTCQAYNTQNKTNCGCHFCSSNMTGDCRNSKEIDFFRPINYEITLIAATRPDIIQQENLFRVYTGSKIVKPRPPALLEDVTYSRLANISWDAPANLPHSLYRMNYTVSYTSKWNTVPETRITSELSIELVELHPWTQYNINITAILYEGIYESDISHKMIRTDAEAPSVAPFLAPGSYRQRSSGCMVLLWQEINEFNRNGEIQRYVVRIGENDIRNVPKSGFQYELCHDRSDAFIVSISATTGPDLEGPRSSIRIPSESEELEPLKYVDGVVSSSGDEVKFTIVPPDGIEVQNYTLLYCDQQSCQTGPHTVILPSNTSVYTLTGHHEDKVYALAVNSEHSSSGLPRLWLCLYNEIGDPGVVESDHLDLYARTERSLTIEWDHLTCKGSGSPIGKVDLYRILVVDNSTNEIVYSRNETVILGQERYQSTITNLMPYTEYIVFMQACSEYHCDDEQSSKRMRILESAPTDPPQNVVILNSASNFLSVSWQPPVIPNGIIQSYRVEVKVANSLEPYWTKTYSSKTLQANVDSLNGYVNYSVQVIARNNRADSPASEAQFVFTPMRAPSMVRNMDLKRLDNYTVYCSWDPPEPPNGPNPYYLIFVNETKKKKVPTATLR